jgi:hypothetical protein
MTRHESSLRIRPATADDHAAVEGLWKEQNAYQRLWSHCG